MKHLVLFCFLLISVEAQRGRGPCPGGGRPSCADRSRPTPQIRKPPLCKNGANPVCSDGNPPPRPGGNPPPRPGNPPPRPGPCDGGSQPMCGSMSPVCPDGSTLATSGRPCARGIPICKDRSKRPMCAAGGKPFGGSSGSTGTAQAQQPGTLQQPGGGYETSLKIRQTWDQEPRGFDREALVKVPPTSTGQKLPVVIDLHGAGGSANLRRLRDIAESFVIVAASGYKRFWNVYSEASKADDVEFLLRLIKKVGEDIPEADIDNVTIVGTSNGAGMIYRLLMETKNPRPFKRVIPLVSSLINIQYHDDSFWMSDNNTKLWNIPTAPDSPGPQILHIHGTADGTVPYFGGGGNFLGEEVDFLDAQYSDFVWAKSFGYTGDKLDDSAGIEVSSGVFKYEYLGGQVVHYKMVDMAHGALGSQYKKFIMDTIRSAASQ